MVITRTPNANNLCLVCTINLPSGVDQLITGCQLEPGPVATPYEQRPIATELALSQRYFFRAPNDHIIYNASAVSGKGYSVTAPLPQTMRAAPAISNLTSNGSSGFSTPSVNRSTPSSVTFVAVCSATDDNGYYWAGFDADAEL